ncbi:1-(5-phosphoribosyl)-5-amino-4-imidazole-carboxylate carboxylase, partial [Actinosynnema sp. NPDC023658]
MREPADPGWVDVHPEPRRGLPEVVPGAGRTADPVVGDVVRALLSGPGPVLVTGDEPDTATAVLAAVPGGRHHAGAGLLVWQPPPATGFRVVVVAGTGDRRVTREAAAVSTALGLDVTVLTDLGTAGLRGLLAEL